VGTFAEWTADDAAHHIAIPAAFDDKYSRGVLGVITGSREYPGAAVLGVEAALRTGVGMVRFRGPTEAAGLVLQRRPEAVTSAGRVQAWLIGSGIDFENRDETGFDEALESAVPTVLDGGALDIVHRATWPVVLTPHYGELARLLGADVADVQSDPPFWAHRASTELGVTVLLKGHTTWVAGAGENYSIAQAPTWLATAGAGDALAGILGALVATHSSGIADAPALLARLAATACFVHGRAAARASAGGPLTILDLCEAIPATIAELIGTVARSTK
jgi:hydroxyethylthiazole kinase-like uncharacterized protein yjeF